MARCTCLDNARTCARHDADNDALRARVAELEAALRNERDWTQALGADSRGQQAMLDRVCDVIGHKGRTDKTDVAALVASALKTVAERQRERIASAAEAHGWDEREVRSIRITPLVTEGGE